VRRVYEVLGPTTLVILWFGAQQVLSDELTVGALIGNRPAKSPGLIERRALRAQRHFHAETL
jgi:hypothetical protein